VAVSEISALEPVHAPPAPTRKPVSKGTQILIGVGMLIAGIVLLWVTLVPLGEVAGAVKVPLFFIACALMFMGYGRIGKAFWGPRWDPGFWLCTTWLVLLTLAAIFADLLPLAEHQDTTKTIAVPGNQPPDLFSKHPLGTNNFSLDLLARCIYGARVSLATSIFAVVVSILIGATIGMFAGYFRGALDTVVGVFTDAILAFPALILLVALAAVLGMPTEVPEAIFKNGIALAVVGIPTMVRLARANTMVFAQREFVLASRAMGAKNTRIIFKELMPNVILPIISYAFIIVAVLIVAEGSLAFLGLGLQQPKPSWGNMIAEGGLTVLREHPFIPLVPGVFMFLTVFSFNRVGERARDLWDPRESKV
jgi:peptide/nickel transport system permease protein